MKRVIIEVNGSEQSEKAEAIREAVDRMLRASDIVNVNVYTEKELKVMCKYIMILKNQWERLPGL